MDVVLISPSLIYWPISRPVSFPDLQLFGCSESTRAAQRRFNTHLAVHQLHLVSLCLINIRNSCFMLVRDLVIREWVDSLIQSRLFERFFVRPKKKESPPWEKFVTRVPYTILYSKIPNMFQRYAVSESRVNSYWLTDHLTHWFTDSLKSASADQTKPNTQQIKQYGSIQHFFRTFFFFWSFLSNLDSQSSTILSLLSSVLPLTRHLLWLVSVVHHIADFYTMTVIVCLYDSHLVNNIPEI